MTLINIKFSPEMEELILQGKKCCTTRDEEKGEPGDVFRVGNRIYRIVGIIEDIFEYIEPYYQCDGFNSEEEYVSKLGEIYHDVTPRDIAYIHFFAYVGYACDNFGYSGQCFGKETCDVGEFCSKKKVVPL